MKRELPHTASVSGDIIWPAKRLFWIFLSLCVPPLFSAPSLHQPYHMLMIKRSTITQFSFCCSAAPPSLKRMKNPVLVDEGSRLIVRCEASGNPTPQYKWYKDGAELKKSKEIKISKNGRWVSTSTNTHQQNPSSSSRRLSDVLSVDRDLHISQALYPYGQPAKDCLCPCN